MAWEGGSDERLLPEQQSNEIVQPLHLTPGRIEQDGVGFGWPETGQGRIVMEWLHARVCMVTRLSRKEQPGETSLQILTKVCEGVMETLPIWMYDNS